ncbi:hypothetical protein L208DRAFT_1538985 [Tricholoma matsutake]|nr:hypothetical protein L208DRAFT_1538985 [Tricholoma matsutake 945]
MRSPKSSTPKFTTNVAARSSYLIRWEGYQGTDEETSWLHVMELDHAQELLADFHTRYPQKPGPLPP